MAKLKIAHAIAKAAAKAVEFALETIWSKRGAKNGIASLDGSGKVPAEQLPASAGGLSATLVAQGTVNSTTHTEISLSSNTHYRVKVWFESTVPTWGVYDVYTGVPYAVETVVVDSHKDGNVSVLPIELGTSTVGIKIARSAPYVLSYEIYKLPT